MAAMSRSARPIFLSFLFCRKRSNSIRRRGVERDDLKHGQMPHGAEHALLGTKQAGTVFGLQKSVMSATEDFDLRNDGDRRNLGGIAETVP